VFAISVRAQASGLASDNRSGQIGPHGSAAERGRVTDCATAAILRGTVQAAVCVAQHLADGIGAAI